MKLIWSFAFVMCLMAPSAWAGATKAKCTCDLDGNDREDGAEVTNASACFSSDFPNKNWCNIEVETLDSSSRHSERVRNILGLSGGDEILQFWEQLFRQYIEQAPERPSSAIDEDLASMFSFSVGQSFSVRQSALSSCMNDFQTFASGEPIEGAFFVGEGVSCLVSSETGWLHVIVAGDGANLMYHIAPLPTQ